MENLKQYYVENSRDFGWGDVGKVSAERKTILDKWVVGETVLDVGCAVGNYVDYLERSGFWATGVDFVGEFVAQARRMRGGRFVIGDARRLPFSDKSFDTIVLFDVLEHVDHDIVLSESTRVARRRIIALVPRKTDKEIERAGLIFRHHLDRSHLRVYTREDLTRLFVTHGLEVVNIEGADRVIPTGVEFSDTVGGRLFRLCYRCIHRILATSPLVKRFYSEYLVVGDIN